MQTLKSLFVTLLILGGAFLAYDYYLAPDSDKLVFKRPAQAKPESQQAAAPGSPVTPAPVEMVTPPPPVVAATPPPVMPSVPSPAPAPAPPAHPDGFVPPAIPDVVQATQNWKRIPASAFPRQARLNRAITFTASFGATEVAAGSEVTVISANDGILTVAPNAQSSLRGTVELESTDLKETLTKVYEAWRTRRIEAARVAWERRNDAPAAPATPAVASDGKPAMGPDGTYPLLLASMKAGEVTEITPSNVTRWGQPARGEHKGQPCWDVPVDFDAQTAFGKFSSTAIAKVVQGRVAGWYYDGSGEVVP